MTSRVFALVAFLTASGSVVAQPDYTVSADTVWYSGQGPWPPEVAFSLTSRDADTLSVTFPVTSYDGFYGTTTGVGWTFQVETPDSLYEYVFLPYGHGGLPTINLAPEQKADFLIEWLDPCPACRTMSARPDTLSDMLHLRVTDGEQADTAIVVLQTPYPVASEPSPESIPFPVEVYPNPTPGPLTLRVESDEPWAGEAIVIDVLGRIWIGVRVETGAPLSLDVGDLAAGTYFVRVVTERGAVTAPFVVSR